MKATLSTKTPRHLIAKAYTPSAFFDSFKIPPRNFRNFRFSRLAFRHATARFDRPPPLIPTPGQSSLKSRRFISIRAFTPLRSAVSGKLERTPEPPDKIIARFVRPRQIGANLINGNPRGADQLKSVAFQAAAAKKEAARERNKLVSGD